MIKNHFYNYIINLSMKKLNYVIDTHTHLGFWKTIKECEHTEINIFGKVITIKTRKALWCQIVHGGNVLNKVKGEPVKNTKDFSSRYNFNTGKKINV